MRSPEPEGLDFYLDRLRSGTSKIEILREISESTESISKGVKLAGLHNAVRKNKLAKLPIIGRILKLFVASDGNSFAERRLRVIEQQVFALGSELGARLERIEGSLNGFRDLNPPQDPRSTNLAEGFSTRNPVVHGHIGLRESKEPSDKIVDDVVESVVRRQLVEPRIDVDPVITPTPPGERTLYYYVDHTVRCPVNTGMQRVARRLAAALVAKGERVRFVKWDLKSQELVLIASDELDYLAKWGGPSLTLAQKETYATDSQERSVAPFHKLGEGSWLLVPEVTHITFQPTAMTLSVLETGKKHGLKVAFVFYDATPLRRHELIGMANAHATYMQQLLLADLVIPISHWVAKDLLSYWRYHQLATRAAGPCVRTIALPGESQLAGRAGTTEGRPTGEPFILCVGSIVPHKNQLSLVRAFNLFCAVNPSSTWRLLLAGSLHDDVKAEFTAMTSSNAKIKYLGAIDDEELTQLYHACSFTAFPSVLEGFGLPILESLWFGKPCVCANFGAMAEVAADGGCLEVDTTDVEELRAAISELIGDPSKLTALTAEATNRSIETWPQYASKLVENLDELNSPLSKLGNIYYFVDHTCKYASNTGIQRVTRALARSLLEQGANLIPVKWSAEQQSVIAISDEERDHLERWNGPKASQWSPWISIEKVTPRDWLLVPELTHFYTAVIHDFGIKAGLRCAWIFYDCIPWKMRQIYSQAATDAHEEYMTSLSRVERVFAISKFSRNDLLGYLTARDVRCGEIEERLKACVLPGEFLETKRVLSSKRRPESGSIRILSVGTVEPRKNHLRLLEAVKIAQTRTKLSIELVIAGGDPFPDLASQIQERVDSIKGATWIRRIDDRGLQERYLNCDFTVYPSVEEGFGLPILESLWNGKPCVCARFGAMLEVAEGGGCVTVDVLDPESIATGICQLIDDRALRECLIKDAITREFKTWRDYGLEMLTLLANERTPLFKLSESDQCFTESELLVEMPNIARRPVLSICISTYNRAGWLALSLKNLQRLIPHPTPDIEILVCDNTSTDSTPTVVEPYSGRSDFRYVRNTANVGMLGNLRVTAHHAQGEYIWILGDDDLLMAGSVERVLGAIKAHAGIGLVYLNYAYTRVDKADEVEDLERFLGESTPVVAPGPDLFATVRDICAQSENFFTAIYCLVFRRDQALRAYSQDTSGRPFSTMLTSIPTTYHVLNYMMDEPAYWIGSPQLVVNLNVSWMRYAALWILERLPEAFDVAERHGGNPEKIDRWRINLVPHILDHYNQIFSSDPAGNAEYVSIVRLVNRFKHIREFRDIVGNLRETYERAHRQENLLAINPPEKVFAAFESPRFHNGG